MKTTHTTLGLVLAALSAAATAAPFEMAPHGESYLGPKTLKIEVAPAAKGDKALIKVQGINHAWDGKVVLADLQRGSDGRADYRIRWQGKDWLLLQDRRDRGVYLYLPGTQDLRLSLQREASLALQPASIAADYERADGAVR